MKKNLFELATVISVQEKACVFTKGSKTAVILEEGETKHSEIDLAKALLKTKAYKTNSELAGAVDAVLTVKVKEEKKEAEKPAEKSNTSRDGEPARRARGY